MLFTYVCLFRCKRFSLRGIEKLEISPTVKTQLVLGSNGSGKSSLLELGFSVMPHNKKSFNPGGYSIRHVQHRGKQYELKFTFDGTPEHSFKVDGVELNQGKTESVQRELVSEHFQMTQELHNLLIGREKFTNMAPNRRRDWITKMSAADFNYALGIYNKVKKGARDAAAVVKHNINRLAQETSKLRSQDEQQVLLAKSEELRNELQALMQESNPQLAQRLSQLTAHARELYDEVKPAAAQLASYSIVTLEGQTFTSIQEAEEKLQEEIRDASELEGALASLSEEFENVEQQLREIEQIEGKDPAAIRKRIGELDQAIERARAKLPAGLSLEDCTVTLATQSKIEDLITMLAGLRTGDRFEADQVTYHENMLDESRQKIEAVNNQLARIETRFEHIRSCAEVQCPNCSTAFKPGVKMDEETYLNQQQRKGEDLLIKHQASLQTAMDFLGGYREYRSQLNKLYQFRQSNTQLAGLWKLIDKEGGFERGVVLTPICQDFLNGCAAAEHLRRFIREQDSLKATLSEIDAVNGSSNLIRERFEKIEQKIRGVSERLTEKRARIQKLKQVVGTNRNYDQQLEKFNNTLTTLKKVLDECTEAHRQAELSELIKRNQISLAMIESTLTENEVQEGIIKDIQNEIDRMTVQETAYRHLMDMLSPTDGLIAEQIGVFIDSIVDRMNRNINRIWGYNLTVMGCDAGNGDLDYRFPMYAVAKENMINDVSEGSESQVDIVNQAFRLVVYKFFRLHGYPLYIDELGSSFDEVHRHNLVPAIKELIEDDLFSQVLIISHYTDGQGSYPNAQQIVLDPSHLSIKVDRNDHVTIS